MDILERRRIMVSVHTFTILALNFTIVLYGDDNINNDDELFMEKRTEKLRGDRNQNICRSLTFLQSTKTLTT